MGEVLIYKYITSLHIAIGSVMAPLLGILIIVYNIFIPSINVITLLISMCTGKWTPNTDTLIIHGLTIL